MLLQTGYAIHLHLGAANPGILRRNEDIFYQKCYFCLAYSSSYVCLGGWTVITLVSLHTCKSVWVLSGSVALSLLFCTFALVCLHRVESFAMLLNKNQWLSC